MRWLIVMLLAGSVGAADAPRAGKFTLKNGDRMDVTMQGYTLAEGFSFSHADIAGKLRIKTDALRQINLNPVPTPAAARRHGALVHLFNGDELAGDIIKLTGQSLEFDTWYAGKLSIPREQVQWLVPGTGGVVFDGPKSLNGWGAAIIGVLLGDEDRPLPNRLATMGVRESPSPYRCSRMATKARRIGALSIRIEK